MINFDNRANTVFYLIFFLFFLSLFSLVSISILKWSSLSFISRIRLLSLILLHLFFIIMIHFLKSTLQLTIIKLAEWTICTNGGIFIVTNLTQLIIYIRNPKFVQNLSLFQQSLDPIERALVGFWNYIFMAMWVYNSACFIILLLVAVIWKKYQQFQDQRRERELRERIKRVEYDWGKYETQTHCAICLLEYEEGEVIELLPCRHIFHDECLGVWLEENVTCPFCRTSII